MSPSRLWLTAAAVLALAACQKQAEREPATPAVPAGGEVAMSHDASPSLAEPDAKLFFQLALLEGHLNIGRELIESGHADQSLPHFGHPVRELYGDIRPLLSRRNIPQFYRDLVKLEALAASAPTSEEFKATYAKVMAQVDAARASIPASMQATEEFHLRIAAAVMRTAAQEYRNAVVAGKVANAVEYHDARGFVFYARTLTQAGGLQGASARSADATRILDRACDALAPLEPPVQPRMTPEAFETLATQLEAVRAQAS